MVIFCFQNIKKNSNAIKSISRSGVTFTATKLNNTTFTFTQQDNNTTYANYKGATTAASGTQGLVPAATTANRLKFLRGDATWQVPTDTTYAAATASALGLVKIGSNITNSSGTISLTKANVTAALGYTPPTTDTNTTYDLSYTAGTGTLNTAYCQSDGMVNYRKQKCNGKFITVIQFDVRFKSTYSSDNVAVIASDLPGSVVGGMIALCQGVSQNIGAAGSVNITTDGKLRPWYCGNVSGHWFGTVTYISN